MSDHEEYLRKEIEEIKKELDKDDLKLDGFLEALRTNSNALNTLTNMVREDHLMLLNHNKILVTGNGEPSLLEAFRTYNKTLTDFINEVREERLKREKKEEQEGLDKKEEKRRWKWAFIGLGFTLIPAFLYQFFIFWTTVVPELSKIP